MVLFIGLGSLNNTPPLRCKSICIRAYDNDVCLMNQDVLLADFSELTNQNKFLTIYGWDRCPPHNNTKG